MCCCMHKTNAFFSLLVSFDGIEGKHILTLNRALFYTIGLDLLYDFGVLF